MRYTRKHRDQGGRSMASPAGVVTVGLKMVTAGSIRAFIAIGSAMCNGGVWRSDDVRPKVASGSSRRSQPFGYPGIEHRITSAGRVEGYNAFVERRRTGPLRLPHDQSATPLPAGTSRRTAPISHRRCRRGNGVAGSGAAARRNRDRTRWAACTSIAEGRQAFARSFTSITESPADRRTAARANAPR